MIFAKSMRVLGILMFAFLLEGCTEPNNVDDAQKSDAATNESTNQMSKHPGIDKPTVDKTKTADVTIVAVSGNSGAYYWRGSCDCSRSYERSSLWRHRAEGNSGGRIRANRVARRLRRWC